MTTQNHIQQTQEVYDAIKDSVTDGIDSSNIITIISNLIPLVEKVIKEKHQGPLKKQIVIEVLTMLVNDSVTNQNVKNTLLLIIHTTVPTVIDTMIDIGKGNIDLGKHSTNPNVQQCCNVS